jgi:methanogenic corrinoid protein MtbC1
LQKALKRVVRFDQTGLEKVLDIAAVNLPRLKYLYHFIQPLFAKIGDKWAAGELKIIHERLATIVIRSQLLEMIRSVNLSASAPRIVVAAPVGQWHETGCLVAALTAAEFGWRPMYFGPNLPAEEIAAAGRNTDAKIIALSIGHKIDRPLIVREIRKLNNYCENQFKIIVGGYGAPGLKPHLDPIGIRCISDANNFSKELETT